MDKNTLDTREKIIEFNGREKLTICPGDLFFYNSFSDYKKLKTYKNPRESYHANEQIALSKACLLYLGLANQKFYQFLYENKKIYISRKIFHKAYKSKSLTK